jgi:hypothetical protein
MLAPQPIPVSLLLEGLLEDGAVCFFEGAGEAEEVWPFTSKVWAALAVAAIRTAKPSDLLNAECTIPPSDLLPYRLPVGDRDTLLPFRRRSDARTS